MAPTTWYIATPAGWKRADGAGQVENPAPSGDGDVFVLNKTEPVETNTGCFRVPEASLKPYAGSFTNWKSTDAPISGLAITGQIKFAQSGGTMRDCLVLGGPTPLATGQDWALADCTSSTGLNQYFEFVTFRASNPSVDIYGPKGGNVHLYRCLVEGVVDGLKPLGSSTAVKPYIAEGCLVRDLRAYDVDPRQSGGPTHGDGCQAAGNLQLVVRGTSIYGGGTSCILIQQNQGLYTECTLEWNWLRGAPLTGSTINITETSKGPVNNLTIRGNRVSDAGHKPAVLIPDTTRNASTTVLPTSGPDANIWLDGPLAGQPVTISRGA